MPDQPASGVHLVGSFPLPDAEAVFRSTAETLGDRVQRVPDGEFGPRQGWVIYQFQCFADHPQLEVKTYEAGTSYGPPMYVTVKDGVRPADVVFDGLGYLQHATESFAIFDRLQSEGAIPSGWRFQVSLPTPLATLAVFFDNELKAEIEPAYEAGMMAEVDAIVDAIPHDRLAIQWDTAVEFGMLETKELEPWFPGTLDGILERVVRLGDRVPEGVDLGYHLCYGDFGHKHFQDPKDTGLLVEVANGISARITRSVQWIHMPVPRGRDDDAYFAPLAGLKLRPETKLYLGLVHHTDGVEGTWRRIRAARRTVDDFGVGTECGMGRRPPETYTELMAVHAEVAAARPLATFDSAHAGTGVPTLDDEMVGGIADVSVDHGAVESEA